MSCFVLTQRRKAINEHDLPWTDRFSLRGVSNKGRHQRFQACWSDDTFLGLAVKGLTHMTDKTDRGKGRDEVPVELAMLTADEIARVVNCSPRTVHRLADDGVIPQPVRIGGMLRWRRPDIEGWIERGCPRVVAEEVK